MKGYVILFAAVLLAAGCGAKGETPQIETTVAKATDKAAKVTDKSGVEADITTEAAGNEPSQENDRKSVAQAFVTDLMRQDYDKLAADYPYDDKMSQNVSDGLLEAALREASDSFGKLEEMGQPVITMRGGKHDGWHPLPHGDFQRRRQCDF